MAVVVALLVLVLASPAVYAVDHVVGGSSGWSQNADYGTWASGQTFTVGDRLIFNYGGSHSVDEVSQSDYNSCSSSNAINSYSGGQTTIPLPRAGPMYFTCPTFGHCGQGMKLSITVQAAAGGSPGGSTPSTPATPSTPGGSSPSTPTTPSTPPGSSTPNSRTAPAGPNGASGNSISHLMLVFSVVLVALIGFRG